MSLLIRLVACCVLAGVALPLSAQDFSHLFKNRAEQSASESTPGKIAQAVYASLSDMQDQQQTQQTSFEAVPKPTAASLPVTVSISDANGSSVRSSAQLAEQPPKASVVQPDHQPAAQQVTQPVTLSINDPVTPMPAMPVPERVTLPSVTESGVGASVHDYLSVNQDYGLEQVSCGIDGCDAGPGCGVTSTLDLGLGCDDTGCDSCGGCGEIACGSLCSRKCPECCGVGTHYTTIYGEALYLRARSAEVAYAVPVDGPIVAGQPAPIQVGNIGLLDPDYELGFRAGVNLALDTVSSIDVRYTLFESLTEGESSAIAPFALRSLVTHPATASAAQDALSAVASLEIDYDTIDVRYRHLLKCSDVFAANYVIGGRYSKLEQQFDVEFLKLGTENVSTDVDFDGAGIQLGLETQRFSCRNQLHIYANGYASFLAGRFRARYFQGQSFDPEVVNAEWEAGRVVPVLDLECGVGWTSTGGKFRLNAGYMVSAWFNSVSSQEYINAIQTNNFLDLTDTMWFDGLQARVSFQF